MKASPVQEKDHIEIQMKSKSILLRDSCLVFFYLFGLISPCHFFFFLIFLTGSKMQCYSNSTLKQF